MIFTKLEVINFRHIQNQNIELGSVITAIAGQNGTGKSTMLGWISESCDSKLKNKSLLDSAFKSKYSEIFRFCPNQDYKNTYEVSIHYSEGVEDKIKKMSTRLIETENRYRVDFDGRGNAIDYPVLYLGLKRLIPLATERTIELKNHELGGSDKQQFAKLSKEILFLTRDVIQAELVKSTNKQIFAMKTEDYGHLGNSAGQDNLGQIISAILSFNKLKSELSESYDGGILLIDEIDATLYAGSQVKLVEKLLYLAKQFNVQIVFTTHSLEILEYLSSKVGEEIKINFLKWNNKNVVNEVNPNYNSLRNIIKVQTGVVPKIEKKQFICEDEVAENWCKNLLNGTDLKSYVEVVKGPFSEGTLAIMAESKHPIFKDTYFILDGDCKTKYHKSPPPRTVFLPSDKSPEAVMYNFIKTLDDNDEFWNLEMNFTHQTCFGNFINSNYKTWFTDDNNKIYFKKNWSRVFNRWKKSNSTEANKFLDDMKNIMKH